jgi:nucleoside-diphosphate-sugar epimerase
MHPHEAGDGFAAAPPITVVTGASGWLGRSLMKALVQRPGRIRALVRDDLEGAELRVRSPAIEAVAGDVRDPAAIDRLFDGVRDATVFHVAAVIHPTNGVRELFDVNVGGTALVLDRARRSHSRRLVHVSSNSPFGANPTRDDVFDEAAAFNPYMGYGASKMEAEQLIARGSASGDVETVVIRPPWFYGPEQPERQTSFFTMVRRGAFPLCGDGENRRSLAYTDNLVQGLLRAERREGVGGRAYWIADARPYSMNEIISAVRAALEANGLAVSRQKVRLPSFAADVAEWSDGLLQRRGIYVQAVHVLSEMNKTIACSIQRARDDLGYEPEIGLDEGMRRSVRWCLDHGMAI